MTDIADFLLARIAEDEASAREITNPINFTTYGPHKVVVSDDGLAAVAAHPARILAECEAKRSVIAAAQAAAEEPIGKVWPPHVHMTGMADGLRMALGYLALPYADHPDYRQEWRP